MKWRGRGAWASYQDSQLTALRYQCRKRSFQRIPEEIPETRIRTQSLEQETDQVQDKASKLTDASSLTSAG